MTTTEMTSRRSFFRRVVGALAAVVLAPLGSLIKPLRCRYISEFRMATLPADHPSYPKLILHVRKMQSETDTQETTNA